MNEYIAIVGESENKLHVKLARRDTIAAGISPNIHKERSSKFFSLISQAKGVQLIVPEIWIEESREILEIKFI
jgi:hypothetical protein